MEKLLQFSNESRLGVVASVDTSRVAVDIDNSDLLTRVGIGQLIAIQGATEREFLIAITDSVARNIRDGLDFTDEDDPSNLLLSPSMADTLVCVLIGTFRSVEGERQNVFKRGADSFPQIDRQCFLIEGGNLQRFMGILGAGLKDEEKLKLGRFVADVSAEAIASGDRFFQRHAAILGSTGSGKSWAVALILERASSLNYPNIIVLDMHGEYTPLADASNGGFAKRYRIAGPGDLNKVNDEAVYLPYWLLNRDEMLSMILDRSDQNAPNQASRFTLHVRELKREALERFGRDEVARTFTVDSPIPYDMDDLIKRLDSDNTEKVPSATTGKPVNGDWNGKLSRFLSRLEAKREDRRYGFMFSPPPSAMEYGWLANQIAKLLASHKGNGIKIVDFSEVPSDILPIVTGTFARMLYDVQFWMAPEARTPVTLLCDEAHLYLPVRDDADSTQKQALASFERIAKEGRKYGFSLVVVSQRPSDVSRTILSQCNNFLALRLTNDTDQGVIRRLMPDSLAGLTSVLPLLDTGEALMLGDAVLLPTRIKLDRPRISPDSATRDFWREWAEHQPDEDALRHAVECLRRQSRGSS
ncbi:MAG: ATP-binding protein [Salinarimonas sp.]